MQPVTVRAATHNDIKTLLDFEQGLINAERPFDPTLLDETIYYYDLPEMIDNPDVAVLLAQIGDEVVGVGTARILLADIFLKHTQFALLRFMYVLPAHRGKGINNIIMEALKQWCLEKGVTELRLSVYEGNDPAINAYKKTGFSNILIEMRMQL